MCVGLQQRNKTEGGGKERTGEEKGKKMGLKDASAYWRLAGMSYLKYANLVRLFWRQFEH